MAWTMFGLCLDYAWTYSSALDVRRLSTFIGRRSCALAILALVAAGLPPCLWSVTEGSGTGTESLVGQVDPTAQDGSGISRIDDLLYFEKLCRSEG